MNPLEPNDPLWSLLGKTREVKIRGNFVQNVVREARNTPQERGALVALIAWFKGASVGTVSHGWLRPSLALAAVALLSWFSFDPQPETSAALALKTEPPAAAMSAEDEAMIELADALPTMPFEMANEMDVLLAMDDAAVLTDQELAFLLY